MRFSNLIVDFTTKPHFPGCSQLTRRGTITILSVELVKTKEIEMDLERKKISEKKFGESFLPEAITYAIPKELVQMLQLHPVLLPLLKLNTFQILLKLPTFQTLLRLINLSLVASSLKRAAKDNKKIQKVNPNDELELQVIFTDESGISRYTVGKQKTRFHFRGYCYSEALSNAIQSIAPYSHLPVPVLIEGETGTGKEVMADSIHFSSPLKGKFVVLNCATIPPEMAESELFGHAKGAFTGSVRDRPGLVAQAQNGTLFIDEIQDLPKVVQAKFLRFLEDGSFKKLGGDREHTSNARILAASNKDLKILMEKGEFREDLFSRLEGAFVRLPPLRDQPEAIVPLFKIFVNMAHKSFNARNDESNVAKTVNFSDDFEDALIEHSWPRNCRELKNCANNAFIKSRITKGIITGEIIRGILQARESSKSKSITPSDFEKTRIMQALESSKGVVSRAASNLGIPNSTLVDRIRSLGINPSDYKRKEN